MAEMTQELQRHKLSISPKFTSPKHTRKQKRAQYSPENALLASITTHLPVPPMASPTRLLICSIGNPGPLSTTLHSAGHVLLSSLRTALSYPPFHRSRAHGNGLLSTGEPYTLWQSTSLMNISGAGVAAAWREFVRENKTRGDGEVGLVVVHDELELPLGQVKVRGGEASARGHNGVKSVNEKLAGMGMGGGYVRIGVGIGRPESREREVVAGYVLRKMSAAERGKVEGCVGSVERELRALSSR